MNKAMIKIVGISCSLHPASVSRVALLEMRKAAKQKGAQFELVDLSNADWELPLFDPKRKNTPEAYTKIQKLLLESASIVIASPDYHGSMSGVAKNFMDYYWNEFAGKLFGYVCASHEKGLTVMDQMRTSVRQCYGWSLPYGLSLSEADLDTERKSVSNAKTLARVNMMAHDLIHYGQMMHSQFNADKGKEGQGFAAIYK